MTSAFRAASPGGADKPAYVMIPSGAVVTYGQLEARSNQDAHAFRSLGLTVGAHVALLTESNERVLEIAWACRRAGLVYTLIPVHLTAAEAAYIVNDSEARVLFVSERCLRTAEAIRPLVAPDVQIVTVTGPPAGGGEFEALAATMPTEPVADEANGYDMLYSSGTTGKPKGIIIADGGMCAGSDVLMNQFVKLWGASADTVYLSTGPMYHSSPLRSCMSILRLGGTALVLEKFDPELALATIGAYRVTHSQWVPTMFVRMLRLDPAVRSSFDLSSHRVAIHAAAPCPRLIKEQMMEWWGPILYEFYGSTEGIGFVHITPEEWLRRPGSIGKAMGCIAHVVGEDGRELGPYQDGLLYFEGGVSFEYHGDPERTRSVYNDKGWRTAGDIGHMDADGYIYLTDRATFMIISGGVNIYPQEVEDLLLSNPAVADAAVFGVPHDEMGEEVKAVVAPTDFSQAGPELAAELVEYCRSNLAHYKCPRSVEFRATLPRGDNGKLYKRLLREEYLAGATAKAPV